MANQAVTDFLTKEIKVSNNIVTFRLLSRQLSIHVDDAKHELELFHEASRLAKDPVFATYVLTGVAAPRVDQDELTALNSSSGGHIPEIIPSRLVLLVSEVGLKAAKSRFIDAPSQHVHSLSPVLLKDYGLLTSVAERVRQLDIQKGQEHAGQMGMLLSEQAPWPGASNVKPKRVEDAAVKPHIQPVIPANKTTHLERTSSKAVADSTQSTKEPVRQSALNFGTVSKKASTLSSKGVQKTESEAKPLTTSKQTSSKADIRHAPKTKAPAKSETPLATSNSTSPANAKSAASKPAPRTTATTARSKRILHSSDEDEPAPVQPGPAFKRKKSHATSDDDEDSEPHSTSRRRSGSLQAMMDIDDDGVVNGRSSRSASPEHVLSAREAAVAAKAAKAEAKAAKAELLKGVDNKERTSRKRVPKGKKRVVKTRRVKNAKGYMVAEDYSSYEDAEENEPDGNDSDNKTETDYGEDIDIDINGKAIPAKPVPKPKAPKTTTADNSMKRRQTEPSGGTKKAKQTNTAKPGQQKLGSFFGKK